MEVNLIGDSSVMIYNVFDGNSETLEVKFESNLTGVTYTDLDAHNLPLFTLFMLPGHDGLSSMILSTWKTKLITGTIG